MRIDEPDAGADDQRKQALESQPVRIDRGARPPPERTERGVRELEGQVPAAPGVAGLDRTEEDDEENWNRARHLAATVEDHELLDPMLSPERLLFRLFHEEGVVVARASAMAAECRCSRERIHAYLQRFGAEELADMRETDGGVTVTCEFCSRKYRFSLADIGGAN